MTDLPHRPTLFIDRNSGGRTFRALITDAINVRVVLHDEYFTDPTTPDHVWLKEIGELGWIMVSCDFRTSSSPLFLANLKRSQARVFLLHGLEGENSHGKAQCVIDHYEKMIEICKKRDAPSFWKITREGCPIVIDFRHKLGLLRRHGKTNT